MDVRRRVFSSSTSRDSTSPSLEREPTVTDACEWDVHSCMGEQRPLAPPVAIRTPIKGVCKALDVTHPYGAGSREEQEEYDRLSAEIAHLLDLRSEIPVSAKKAIMPLQPALSSSSSKRVPASSALPPTLTTLANPAPSRDANGGKWKKKKKGRKRQETAPASLACAKDIVLAPSSKGMAPKADTVRPRERVEPAPPPVKQANPPPGPQDT